MRRPLATRPPFITRHPRRAALHADLWGNGGEVVMGGNASAGSSVV